MKVIKILGLLFLTTIVFASCSKEDDVMDDLIKPYNEVKIVNTVCEPLPPKVIVTP